MTLFAIEDGSGVGAEQSIEQVAEPSLAHLDLGFCDGNGVWPAVGDGPCAEVVLGRPADERTRIAQQFLVLISSWPRGVTLSAPGTATRRPGGDQTDRRPRECREQRRVHGHELDSMADGERHELAVVLRAVTVANQLEHAPRIHAPKCSTLSRHGRMPGAETST